VPGGLAAPTDRFAAGATVVRRDILRGRVWTAMPQRAVSDTGTALSLAYWPRVTSLAPTTWITALRTGDDAMRKRGLDDLAAGTWELGPHGWERTELLSHFLQGEYFSIHAFQDAATGAPMHWYVNFELPFVRRPGFGIDTFDLFLDLVVAPDLSTHLWKDTEEYAQGRRLGLVDDDLHGHVETARERALGMLQDRSGPFADGWPSWSASPAWPLPVLPVHAETAHTTH
jgi:hypothetical protein